MVIKENEITKLIEDKMGFKFEDLELVGKFNKYVNSCFKIAFYKYKEDFFMFSIYKLKEITSIIKLGSLEMANNKLCYNFFMTINIILLIIKRNSKCINSMRKIPMYIELMTVNIRFLVKRMLK